MLFKYFVEEGKRAIGRCSFNPNSRNLSVEKLIRGEIAEGSQQVYEGNPFTHTFQPSFFQDASRWLLMTLWNCANYPFSFWKYERKVKTFLPAQLWFI